MDTDSLSAAPVFVLSLLLFSYLSLAERAGANGNGPRDTRSPQRASPVLAVFKYSCLFALSLSGLALLHSAEVFGWWPVAFSALGVVAVLILIDQMNAFLVSRKPGGALRSTRPLLRLVRPSVERRANGNNGNFLDSSSNTNDRNLQESALPPDQLPITDEELDTLDNRDREMLRSILRLDIATAHEIMTPRLDLVAIDVNSTLTGAVSLMLESGHARLPVYEDTIDHIVGIIHTRDVLAVLARKETDVSLSLVDLVRPAYFIPETKHLDDLLSELQEKAIQMAIVVDEYGGTEGVVTMEDVLEEIVGEIEDEFSRASDSQLVAPLQEGGVMVDAGVSIESIDELFGSKINNPDVDTIGGFVYRALGKIPQIGDEVVAEQLRIEVVSVLGRRVRKLRITRVNNNQTPVTASVSASSTSTGAQ